MTYESLFSEISNKDTTVSCEYRDNLNSWYEKCKSNPQNFTYQEIQNKENEISQKIEELRVLFIYLIYLIENERSIKLQNYNRKLFR